MPGCPLHNACVRPSWLTGRRDQRPPRGDLVADLVLGDRVSPVGASLLAMRPVHSTSSSTGTPPSRAGSLPHWIFSSHNIHMHTESFCGSELARDEASTSNIFIDCNAAFASKLAPTLELLQTQYPCAPGVLLWERACSRRGQSIQHLHRLERRLREQARSHIGASAATTSICIQSPSVGASLLAMRPAHPTSSSTVTPPSRASSLPHWSFCRHNIRMHPGSFCGSGLAREEASTSNIFIDWNAAFASRLAPTLDLQQPQHPCAPGVLLWERACSR
ncbi:hypothetical protein J3D49_004634 [Pseudomonas kilonensis]|nr:hypothetical protein [Pseudomonas kilonensis]